MEFLNAGLLLGGQSALLTMATTTNPRLNGVKAATLVLLPNRTDVRLTQPDNFRNFSVVLAFFLEADNLPAEFELSLLIELTGIGRFHSESITQP